ADLAPRQAADGPPPDDGLEQHPDRGEEERRPDAPPGQPRDDRARAGPRCREDEHERHDRDRAEVPHPRDEYAVVRRTRDEPEERGAARGHVAPRPPERRERDEAEQADVERWTRARQEQPGRDRGGEARPRLHLRARARVTRRDAAAGRRVGRVRSAFGRGSGGGGRQRGVPSARQAVRSGAGDRARRRNVASGAVPADHLGLVRELGARQDEEARRAEELVGPAGQDPTGAVAAVVRLGLVVLQLLVVLEAAARGPLEQQDVERLLDVVGVQLLVEVDDLVVFFVGRRQRGGRGRDLDVGLLDGLLVVDDVDVEVVVVLVELERLVVLVELEVLVVQIWFFVVEFVFGHGCAPPRRVGQCATPLPDLRSRQLGGRKRLSGERGAGV